MPETLSFNGSNGSNEAYVNAAPLQLSEAELANLSAASLDIREWHAEGEPYPLTQLDIDRLTRDLARGYPEHPDRGQSARPLLGFMAAGAIRYPAHAYGVLEALHSNTMLTLVDYETGIRPVMEADHEGASEDQSMQVRMDALHLAIEAKLQKLDPTVPHQQRLYAALLAYEAGATAADPMRSSAAMYQLESLVRQYAVE